MSDTHFLNAALPSCILFQKYMNASTWSREKKWDFSFYNSFEELHILSIVSDYWFSEKETGWEMRQVGGLLGSSWSDVFV